MNPKYDQILARFEELTSLISDEKVIRDNMRWRKLAKERSDMTDLVEVTARLKKVEETLADNRKIIAANLGRRVGADRRAPAAARAPGAAPTLAQGSSPVATR